jgi:hypothetical protein
MFYFSTTINLRVPVFLLLLFGVSAHVSAAVSNVARESLRQSSVGARSANASKGKAHATNSKVGKMLPSRMYKRVKLTTAATHRLPKIVADAAQGRGGKGQPLQVGVTRPLSLDPATQGVWFDLGADAGRALLLGIISEGAAQVRVQFTAADLPPGAKLFVRSMNDADDAYGAFEGRGVLGNGEFWTPPVSGEGIVIEYVEPHKANSSRRRKKVVPFRVTQISHIFRD